MISILYFKGMVSFQLTLQLLGDYDGYQSKAHEKSAAIRVINKIQPITGQPEIQLF